MGLVTDTGKFTKQCDFAMTTINSASTIQLADAEGNTVIMKLC